MLNRGHVFTYFNSGKAALKTMRDAVRFKRADEALSLCVLLLGLGVIVFAIAITIRCYMPCPFWDEWAVVEAIAKGKGPGSWAWLWSQQNEHRLAIPRLLVWLDLFGFGGKNISLFAEIIVVQCLHWLTICFVIERFTGLPVFLRRSIQGLFAFCLFHPNQLENFTWAFQIGFVLPFTLGTVALIIVAFISRWRRKHLAIVFASLLPIVAGLNLAGGLLIGPAVLAVAYLKRISAGLTVTFAAIYLVSAIAYLFGYRRSATDLSPLSELSRCKDLLVYVLTYFGASWTRLLPHKERIVAFISITAFLALFIKALRKRREVSDFEWFLIGECGLALATALLTAFGRLQFGVGQAFASRYQTPAMIYWAALGSLALLWFHRNWPARIAFSVAAILAVMVLSIFTFPRVWASATSHADGLRVACRTTMGPRFDAHIASKLYENTTVVAKARPFLREVWHEDVTGRDAAPSVRQE